LGLKQQSQDQRERVLEVCLEKVLRYGPNGVEVKRIAEDANVSQSTFFRLFSDTHELLAAFWPWCWQQFNAHLKERSWNDVPTIEPTTALLRQFDYIWDLHEMSVWRDEDVDKDRMRGIAFLCFLYYRRPHELAAPGEVIVASEEQRQFENKVLQLCESVVVNAEVKGADARLLQVTVMSWCASVLMTWQYLPDGLSEITPIYAGHGLRNMVQDVLDGTLAA
jgi:AcrR family transcriptional regulator